jgi:hypothetical protein
MIDQTMTLFWLPLGGLVAVATVLVALWLAVSRLRGELAQRDHAARKVARPGEIAKAQGLTREEIMAIIQTEMAAHHAALRADLAQILVDNGRNLGPKGAELAQDTGDLVDRAIVLARAGHDAGFIAGACALDLADATALVRFHGPGRGAARSPQH